MRPPEPQAGTLQGITLVAQITLAVMGTTVLAPIIPKLIEQFHAVPGALFLAPLVVTIPSLVVSVSSPIIGLLSDRIGRRRLLIGAVAIYGVVGVLPVFLTTLPSLLASRVALGLVEGAITTVTTTLIGDYFVGAACARWLGMQTAVASVSAIGLLALGGFLGDFGWHAPFLVYLSAFPLLAMLVLFTWEPRSAAREASPGWSEFPWGRFAGILVISLVMGMMFYIVQIELSTILHEKGVTSPSRIGLLTALTTIGIPFGTWVFQRVQHWQVAVLLACEFGLLSAGFIGMSHAGGLPLFLGFVTLNQIGGGMGLPTTLTWAMRQLRFHQRGRGTGIWQAVFSFGPPLGPALLTGITVLHGGHFVPAVQYLGVICVVMALGALLTVKRKEGGIFFS